MPRGCCFSDLLIVSRILVLIVACGSLIDLVVFLLKGENDWLISIRSLFLTLHLFSTICAFFAIRSKRSELMIPVIVITALTLVKNMAVVTLTSLAIYSIDTPFAQYLIWLRENNQWYHDFAATYETEEKYIKMYSIGATVSVAIILLICIRAIYVHYCAYQILQNRSNNRQMFTKEMMKNSQLSIISKA
ncbi:hypothetical protein PMAYCL1PPCAC_15004 [Pristionchus mayeri]|uniref:Uncharacterized protein n=1 Tax=Pristionchus mayeri TaxID=1317129 RepID=A0AAN5CI53_9BILA|nr:hypothetical protein PMAYCL1PPCAC_15004 [Pristionchus mayeri]